MDKEIGRIDIGENLGSNTQIDLSMFSGSIASTFSKKIEALSPDIKKDLIKLWEDEPEKNIGKLIQLLKTINTKNNGDISKQVIETGNIAQVTGNIAQVTGNIAQVTTRERVDYQKISAGLIEATNLTLESAKNISQGTNGEFDKEIDTTVASIQSGNVTPEISAFLEKNNIDPKNKEQLARPEVLDIIRAGVSTEVYLRNKALILQKNPKLAGDMANIESLSYNFWGEKRATSKNIETILTDQPQKNRETIQEATKTLTKDHPDTIITRKGDILTFDDPKNKNNQYEINIANYPPILTKKRNGLEIRMQLSGNTEKPNKAEKAENKRLDTEKIPLEKTLEGVMSLGTTEKDNNFMPLESDNPKDVNPEGKKKIISPKDIANIKLLLSLKLPAQKGFYLQTLAELQKSFTQKKGEVNEAIIKLNSKSGEMDIFDRMDRFSELQPKQELIENIGKTIERLEDVASKYKDINEDEKSTLEKGIDDFERNSEFNLGYLSRIHYDQLGQKNLSLIIQSINEKNIPEVGQIDPSLNERLTDPQTQKLTLVIANLVRNNTMPDISAPSNTGDPTKKQNEWKDVSRTDPIIAYNQTQTPTFGEALKSVKINLDPNIVKTDSDKRNSRQIINDAITGKVPEEGPNNSN